MVGADGNLQEDNKVEGVGVSPGERLCCLLYPVLSRSAWVAGGSPKAEHHPPEQQAGAPGPQITFWDCGRTTQTEDAQELVWIDSP